MKSKYCITGTPAELDNAQSFLAARGYKPYGLFNNERYLIVNTLSREYWGSNNRSDYCDIITVTDLSKEYEMPLPKAPEGEGLLAICERLQNTLRLQRECLERLEKLL